MMASRLRLLAGVVVVAAIVAAAASPGGSMTGAGASGAKPSGSGEIYFYGSIGQPINGTGVKNPLLVRPSTLLLFADGSWVITNLRWSGWGSSVARATGVSSASNCKPNCAAGKRTTRPAQFTLSSPGRVQGNMVYRCFQLAVPSYPKSNEHACLGRAGSLILYVSKTATPPTTTQRGQSTTRAGYLAFYSPSRNLWCQIEDHGDAAAHVQCQSWQPPRAATLTLGGRLKTCTGLQCLVQVEGEAPTEVLAYGSRVALGRFRCLSQSVGITCTVIRSGKGFLINGASVTKAGQ